MNSINDSGEQLSNLSNHTQTAPLQWLSRTWHGIGTTGESTQHTWLGAVKEVRVIAAFPELHQDVEQAHLVRLASTIHYVNVLHQDLCVPDDSNINVIVIQPSVLWRCQLGGRKDFRPVKN